jgi:hypothetical protein
MGEGSRELGCGGEGSRGEQGADVARCRVPVCAHTHADPAPLAVAESADGADSGRDAERGAGGQGRWRSAAGGGHLVHLGHGAQPQVGPPARSSTSVAGPTSTTARRTG